VTVRIGVPGEVKVQEYRVAATPDGVRELVANGHEVVVQRGAGEGSSFADADYAAAGASLGSAADAWDAELVLKVKEPQAPEYGFLRDDLTLFTYLHLAADRALTDALIESGTTAIAYETVREADGSLPLLAPMSEIAGQLAVLAGVGYLQRPQGGRGLLPGSVPGIPPSRVVVVGGGAVGYNAALVALGIGAAVQLLDTSIARLRVLKSQLPGAELLVSDSGEGIDPAELPFVFDRFYRGARASGSRAAGSGLGLSIVRSIVEMHNGRVAISSTPGAGTQVSVFLPRDVSVSSPAAARS